MRAFKQFSKVRSTLRVSQTMNAANKEIRRKNHLRLICVHVYQRNGERCSFSLSF